MVISLLALGTTALIEVHALCVKKDIFCEQVRWRFVEPSFHCHADLTKGQTKLQIGRKKHYSTESIDYGARNKNTN